MNKYIGIWYSCGDVEYPVEVPEGKDEFDYMLDIAMKEVKVSVIEAEDAVTVGMTEDESGNEIVMLRYHCDDEICYYKIFDSEEECQQFLDEYTNEGDDYA